MITLHAMPGHVRAADTPPAYVAQVNAPQDDINDRILTAMKRGCSYMRRG